MKIMLLFLLVSLSCWAIDDQDQVQLTVVGVSDADKPAKAEAEALKDAFDKGCLQLINQIIGEGKVEKNLPAIKSKILAQTQKFIQSYKGDEPKKSGANTSISVSMKISVSSLKEVLGQEGLLYQSEGPSTVLPVFKIVERRDSGRAYRWWIEEAQGPNLFFKEMVKDGIKDLADNFRAKGFYVIDPVSNHYVQFLPDPYRNEYLSLDDLLWMGEFFKAQMVIQGELAFEPGKQGGFVKAVLKLVAYHSSNGRIVGEISRSWETGPVEWEVGVQQIFKSGFKEASKDLTKQVFEEWNKGTFGASLLKLTLDGDVNARDVESFKKQILNTLKDIRAIKERRLATGRVTFDIDVAGGFQSLAKKIEGASFEGFSVSVNSVEADHMRLSWKKKN